MIDKILGFFSGFNGNKTMSQVKSDAGRNKAFIYQQVKRNTPGVMKEWSVLGSIEHGYAIADIDNLLSRLANGEMPALKVEESGTFTDRVALHQVITRDSQIFLHLFRDTKYSNGMDDYITSVEVPNKFATDHLPQDNKILQSRD
jgi:hypothetical protein